MQQRLRDYQAPLGSFLHNLINLGVHKPGRFCGYDTLLPTGALQFSLAHTASGINTFDSTGTPYGPLGVMMTVQGEVLIEDASITGLTINANNTALPRYDIVVMTHQYLPVNPGGAGVYSVVQGVPGQPAPTLQPFQVLVGTLLVPANTAFVYLCSWTKTPTPDSGDSPDAKLNIPNQFSVTNANVADTNNIYEPSVVDPNGFNLFSLPPSGNTFYFGPTADLNIDGLQIAGMPNIDGVEINLVLNPYCVLRSTMPLSPNVSGYADFGFYPIRFAPRLATGQETVTANQPGGGVIQVITNTLTPSAPQLVVGLILVQGFWIVKSIDGPSFDTGGINSGVILMVDMPFANIPFNFDQYGNGIGDWIGYQIANGYQQTNDWRGRVPVAATNVPSAGSPALNPAVLPPGVANLTAPSSGSSNSFLLSRAQLPNFQLRLLSQAEVYPYFVYDSDGGGDYYSLKGDASNNLSGGSGLGAIVTEAVGSGASIQMMPAYQVTLFVAKL